MPHEKGRLPVSESIHNHTTIFQKHTLQYGSIFSQGKDSFLVISTLKASGRTSAMTIQIMHPAAKPVQKGRNLLNASAHINAGTATIGCNAIHKSKTKISLKHYIYTNKHHSLLFMLSSRYVRSNQVNNKLLF